jgi:hypothetical protein
VPTDRQLAKVPMSHWMRLTVPAPGLKYTSRCVPLAFCVTE